MEGGGGAGWAGLDQPGTGGGLAVGPEDAVYLTMMYIQRSQLQWAPGALYQAAAVWSLIRFPDIFSGLGLGKQSPSPPLWARALDADFLPPAPEPP